MLYLSGTTPGQLTNVKPSAPTHTVIVGYVVYAHITQGAIYVKVDNGYELDELHNVLITTPSDGQVLAYESATGLWKNTTNGNIGGSGTTNTVPKFTSSSVIGNSNITDSGSLITLGSNSYVNGKLGVGINVSADTGFYVSQNITGATSAWAARIVATAQSDVSSAAIGIGTQIGTASGAIGHIQHFRATQLTFNSTPANQSAFIVPAGLTGATNNFAFRGQLASATNAWNLYMDGTADNHLAGALGIGSTGLSVYNLRIQRNISGGSVAISVAQQGQMQSGVSFGYGFNNESIISATASATDYIHYRAVQGTWTAGGVVTNQIAFFANSSLTSATNNFAFRGDISVGSGRWNLYMNGTANNYLAGVLTIGTTSPSASALLQMNSTTQGFLPPRMTQAQRTAIASPAVGLIVYQTDGTEGAYQYKSTGWAAL